MLQNYLKVALRNIARYKGYAGINIFGLALGIACSLFIFIWVHDELSYDRFHEHAGHIYRVEQDQHYEGRIFHVTVTPHPVGPAFVEEIPAVIDAVRLDWMRPQLLRAGENAFYEGGILMTDPSFFDVFSFPTLEGDVAAAFVDPYSIVLTRELADKYFPDGDAVGQVLEMENQYPLTVTGVLEDPPHNSSIQFRALMPFQLMHSFGWYNDSWDSNSIQTFVRVEAAVPIDRLNASLQEIKDRHEDDPPGPDYMAMPLTDIHLHAYWGFADPVGAVKYVYTFSIIAVVVLLIACINFMNLATARSQRRAREVGLRKVVGARRSAVAGQFMGETLLYAVIALVIAIGLVGIFLGPSETLTGKPLGLEALLAPSILLGMLGITLVTGLLAGSYPALFLSSFRPADILKQSSTSGSGRGGAAFRRVLVVVQFGLSVFLIIGTGVVYTQLEYMRDFDLGYDQEQLLRIRLRDETQPSMDALEQTWEASPLVHAVTTSRHLPTGIGSNSSGAEWEGKDPESEILISNSAVGYDYVETLGVEMTEGRGFSRNHPSDIRVDTAGAWLVNEAMARVMAKPSVVGEELSFMDVTGPIVGVMRDFHYNSLRADIMPLAMYLDPSSSNFAILRVDGTRVSEALEFIESTWVEVVPDYPFEYWFLDENFDDLYREEARMSTLLSYFAFIAIVVACLGLVGLAAYTAQRRRKEISIRKVLGASYGNVSVLLVREFIALVAVANLIAWPIAYLVSRDWLQGFAYHTDLGLWLFVVAGLGSAAIAVLTVGFHAVKAALEDPVVALRTE